MEQSTSTPKIGGAAPPGPVLAAPAQAGVQPPPKSREKVITWRAFILGAFFAAAFAFLTVLLCNSGAQIEVTANQIPVLPYVLLFGTVLLINPLCRLIRIVRPFTVAEIMIIFVMGMVPSGISIYGLTNYLLPIAGSLFYKDWNTDQKKWDIYIEPYVNDGYFLAEPGIQEAALAYRGVLDAHTDLKEVYDKAVDLRNAEAVWRDKERAAQSEIQKMEALVAKEKAEKQKALWEAARAKFKAPEFAAVLNDYPALLEGQAKRVAGKKQALAELNERAYAKAELFRRGLQRPLQSYPGILPRPEDDSASYFARMGRLFTGRAALKDLEQVSQALAARPGSQALDAAAAVAIAPGIESAIDKLRPHAETAGLEAAHAVLNSEMNDLTQKLGETSKRIADLNWQVRWAVLAEQAALNRQIRELEAQRKDLEAEKKAKEVRVNGNTVQQEIAKRVGSVIEQLRALSENAGMGALTAGAANEKLTAVMQEFSSFDASFHRFFFGDVPWSHWAGPLLRWAVLIALTYLVLMTFNVLIFRQWAYNEKLIYPLAEFPEILVGCKDQAPGIVPEVFRSGLFWIGVSISGLVLGWNLLAYTQVIPGLQALDLENLWEPYIRDSSFKGLLPSAKSAIFFTMIGLAFLIPAKVSFSLWFFWLVYMVQLLVLVWSGYGENEESFAKDWLYNMNFCTAEGGGALLVFASVVLYKCRKYLWCAFSRDSVKDLELDEQKELQLSSALFMGGSLALILVLWLGMGANLFYTVFAYALIMVITIGLVRAVAEGGILGFQAWASPFHFIRTLFGFDKAWSSPALFSPLMLYYAVFFLDIKAFIAPAMANSLKVREDLRMERGKFHLALLVAIVLSVVIALGASLMFSYGAGGADAMNDGFYVWLPRDGFYPHLRAINENPPTASLGTSLWIGVGMLAMTALLYFRQGMFWLPHPIGLIMLVNPLMRVYWFSIFLGWIAKHLVTKYGNKDTYARARALFIGLIVGELVLVTLALLVSYYMNIPCKIHLDRN